MKLNFLDCWKRRKDLPAFESGELPPERAEALAAHLAICDRCRNEWETLAGVAEALRAAPPEPVVPALNLWSRIEAEILEPAPVVPPRPVVSHWKVAALPAGAALAGAAVFAATGGLGVLTPKSTDNTHKVATEVPQAMQATTPVAPIAAIASVVATPEPTPEPIEVDPTPAPTPKAVRLKPRRAITSPRKDPFAPSEKVRKSTPAPDYWNNDDEIVEDATVIAASPPVGEPVVKPITAKDLEPEPDAVIRVERPVPARAARRDAAADAEAAERRAADALGSPLDAVARASQPRKLFP